MENNIPIHPAHVFSKQALCNLPACATRAPTAYGAAGAGLTAINLVKLVAAADNPNGIRVDELFAKSVTTNIAAASANNTVMFWEVDPTNAANLAHIIKELQHISAAASTTVPSVESSAAPTTLTIPAGREVWVGSTVAYSAATQAMDAQLRGGSY